MSNPPASAERSTSPLRVDAAGMEFPFCDSASLDVLFDGRRVWSIAPAEHRRNTDDSCQVPWPDPLRQRLQGRALIELRDHVTEHVVAATEARFGNATGRVQIVDDHGRPVALTKYGRLNHPFESTDRSSIEGYLDQVEEVLRVLREDCGLPAFISFGTLLGAVRTGRLIGHDVDVDLGYLSAFDQPVDIVRETFRVERVLRGKGWRVVRENGGFLALFFPQDDGTSRNLDVFSCFVVNGMLHQVHDIRTRADRSAVVPLQDLSLEGRLLPAPARPDVLLTAAYGAGWRVPDPSFEYHTPRDTKRRIQGWLGGHRARRDYWGRFYNQQGSRVPTEPTRFADWVAAREAPTRLIDLGCGNCRDSLYFAARGFEVTGIDFVPSVLNRAGRAADSAGVSLDLRLGNLQSLRETLGLGALLANSPGDKLLYGRFLLHTLPDPARANFWRLAEMALRGGGRCYLEFRTREDARLPKAFGPSFRRFLAPETVTAEAVRRGASVVHCEAGRDRAPFEDENPHVCRLILEW